MISGGTSNASRKNAPCGRILNWVARVTKPASIRLCNSDTLEAVCILEFDFDSGCIEERFTFQPTFSLDEKGFDFPGTSSLVIANQNARACRELLLRRLITITPQ